MKWRVVRDRFNLSTAPWVGAIGIEEDEDTAAPSVILWITRGWEDPVQIAESIVNQHNAALP